MTDTEVPPRSENAAAYPHAVFVDIDGTLCDSRQRVPDSAVRALARARQRGHRLFLCTGRSTPEVYPRFFDLGFEGLVGGAGGYAAVGDTVLLDERMPDEHVEALTRLWEDLDAFYVWQAPDQMGPSRGYLEFFVPRASENPTDWVEYAESVAPFILHEGDSVRAPGQRLDGTGACRPAGWIPRDHRVGGGRRIPTLRGPPESPVQGGGDRGGVRSHWHPAGTLRCAG